MLKWTHGCVFSAAHHVFGHLVIMVYVHSGGVLDRLLASWVLLLARHWLHIPGPVDFLWSTRANHGGIMLVYVAAIKSDLVFCLGPVIKTAVVEVKKSRHHWCRHDVLNNSQTLFSEIGIKVPWEISSTMWRKHLTRRASRSAGACAHNRSIFKQRMMATLHGTNQTTIATYWPSLLCHNWRSTFSYMFTCVPSVDYIEMHESVFNWLRIYCDSLCLC